MKRAVWILFALLLFSCSQDKGPVEETVRMYNALLAEGYRTLNLNALTQAATLEQATKVYTHMAALGEARLRMEVTLKDIAFPNISFRSREKARARTREVWHYSYVNIDSETVVDDNEVTYEMTYDMERRTDRWLVSEVTIDKETKKKSEDVFRSPQGEKKGE